MAFTVTKPVEAPTGLNASLNAGGSLAASTTYYYVVIAWNSASTSPAYNFVPIHSDISEEDSFTTDATNRSVTITWTNSAGAARYNVLLSTTSGDYTNSGFYGGVAYENIGSITDGTTGVTITSVSTSNAVHHSCQLVNDLVYGFNKNLGMIQIDFTDGTYTAASNPLNTIYNAIIAESPGYGDYVYWDGQNFALKGWITTSGTSSGSLSITQRNITFFRGGLNLDNPNFNVQFGTWVSDAVGASYSDGCHINIQNCRYPFVSRDESNLKVYGCLITKGIPDLETENLAIGYYHGGSQIYLTQKIDEIRDSFQGWGIRGTNSAVKDMKTSIGNNYPNEDLYRCVLTNMRSAAYTDGAKIYLSEFTAGSDTPGANSMRMYVPGAGTTYSSHYYNCMWSWHDDNIPVFVYSTIYGQVTSDSTFNVYNELIVKVVDVNGTPVSGVTVSVKAQDGDPATWIAHDGTVDKAVTGTTYTTDRTTDSNGMVEDYYLRSYTINLAPDNTEAASYCNNIIKTDEYPYTVTLSKAGYPDYEIVVDDFVYPTTLLLKYPVEGFVPNSGNFKQITHKIINGTVN